MGQAWLRWGRRNCEGLTGWDGVGVLWTLLVLEPRLVGGRRHGCRVREATDIGPRARGFAVARLTLDRPALRLPERHRHDHLAVGTDRDREGFPPVPGPPGGPGGGAPAATGY